MTLRREVSDAAGIANMLLRLAALEHRDGDDATARRRAQEALGLARHLHDGRHAARHVGTRCRRSSRRAGAGS